MNCKNIVITSNYIEKNFDKYKIILCSDNFSAQNCKLKFTLSGLVPGKHYDFIFGIGAFRSIDSDNGTQYNNDYFEVYLDKSYKFERKNTDGNILIDYNNNEILGKLYSKFLESQTDSDWHSTIWENVKISFIATSETMNGYFYLKTDEEYANEAWGIIKDSYQICGDFEDNSKKYYFIDEIPYGKADYQIFTSEIHFSDNGYEYGDLYFCIKNPTTVTFNNYTRTINEEGIYKIENIKLSSNNYINIGNDNKGIIIKYHDIYESNYQIPENYICDILGDKSCVLYYPFKKDAKDKCGNNDGIVHGNVIFNDAAIFDGNSYISSKIKINNFDNISFSFWLKQDKIKEIVSCIFTISKDGENTLNLWQFTSENKKMPIFTNDDYDIILDNKYDDNIYYHFVITSNKDVFIDGKLIGKLNRMFEFQKINKDLVIGADIDPNSINNFIQKGSQIKNFRIFNKALTEKEVQKIYNLEK